MRNLRSVFLATSVAMLATHPATATILGPDAAVCEHAAAPAILVRVVGLKSRSGTLRVQSYGGNPATFFDKGTYLKRLEVPVPPAGPVEVCVPVAHPGTYAISVRHDADGNGEKDRADGGGVSGNPRMSLMDIMLHRKPDPKQVAVPVHAGVTAVPVLMNYVQGFSFGPVAGHGS